MIIQIIFMVTLYPILFLVYFGMRAEKNTKSGYCAGVRMQQEWFHDAQIERILEDYQRELKRIVGVLAVIPLATFLMRHISIQLTVWMMWILAVVILPGIPYARANRRMRVWKEERGLRQEGGGAALVEMKQAGAVRRVRLMSFIVPMLVSVAAACVGMYQAWKVEILAYGAMVVSLAAITPLIYWIALWIDTQKTAVVCEDSEVNLNYARAKKNAWSFLWLTLAWMHTAYTVFAAATLGLEQIDVGMLVWGSVIYAAISLLVFLRTLQRMNRIEERYAQKKDASLVENSDDHWIFGIFYYNKKDKHVMVERRAGFGTTVNLATPFGKGFTVFGAVGLLCIPVLCGWIILEEFTPIRLTVEEQVLTAEQLRVTYEIPLETIEDAEMIASLPKWSKVSGTGMEGLEKGTFYIRNEGRCEVFLNPQNEVFLHFTADGTEYYMSGENDEETREIYEWMKGDEK